MCRASGSADSSCRRRTGCRPGRSRGRGVVQLPVRVARPAELRQEVPVRVELLDLIGRLLRDVHVVRRVDGDPGRHVGDPAPRVFTPLDLGNTGTGEPLDTPVAGVCDVDLASRRDRDRLRGRQHAAAVGSQERGAQVVVLLDHVPRRRDPDVVRSIDGHTDRSAERPGRERRARGVEPIDVVVAGDVDHVRAVDGNAGRVQRAPLRQEVARGVELLDPVVARIGHVHVAERVDRDAFRVDELTVPGSVGRPSSLRSCPGRRIAAPG